MRLLAKAVLAILACCFCGCAISLPPAPTGTHWRHELAGAALYCNADDTQAASVIDGQVVIFKGDLGIEDFEYQSEALHYAVAHTRCRE